MYVDLVGPDGSTLSDQRVVSGIGLDGQLLHHFGGYVEVAVSGSACVTSTTLHGPYSDSIAFSADGAVFAEGHRLDFQDSEGAKKSVVGGTLHVLEETATAWEFEVVDGSFCWYGEDYIEVCEPQAAPFWARVSGDVVSPEAPLGVIASDAMADPTSGEPLCVATLDSSDTSE